MQKKSRNCSSFPLICFAARSAPSLTEQMETTICIRAPSFSSWRSIPAPKKLPLSPAWTSSICGIATRRFRPMSRSFVLRRCCQMADLLIFIKSDVWTIIKINPAMLLSKKCFVIIWSMKTTTMPIFPPRTSRSSVHGKRIGARVRSVFRLNITAGTIC